MCHILLMYSDGPPSQEHVARLRAVPGVHSVTSAASDDEALDAAATAEVFVGQRYLRQCLPIAHKLRWVQSTAAGIDHLVTQELRKAGPLLTRCPIFADVIARHAVSLAMALTRRLPESIDAQRARTWRRPVQMLPWPASATVVGVGAIGTSLARLLRAVGIRVTGVERPPFAGEEPVDELLGPGQWRTALAQTDWLFLAIPGREENRDFLDASALSELPSHALVINVGRGMTIDTEALATRLGAGMLGGAALDVTDPDPLPDGHWLWSVPNLLITPKVAAFSPERRPRLEAFVEGQLARYVRGEAPEHAIDYKVSDLGQSS